jgi:hypothetical protein
VLWAWCLRPRVRLGAKGTRQSTLHEAPLLNGRVMQRETAGEVGKLTTKNQNRPRCRRDTASDLVKLCAGFLRRQPRMSRSITERGRLPAPSR